MLLVRGWAHKQASRMQLIDSVFQLREGQLTAPAISRAVQAPSKQSVLGSRTACPSHVLGIAGAFRPPRSHIMPYIRTCI